MTPEQAKALALARARMRVQEQTPSDVSPGMPDEAVETRPTGRLPRASALADLKFKKETQADIDRGMARWGGVKQGLLDPFNAMTQMGTRAGEALFPNMGFGEDRVRSDRMIAEQNQQYENSPARGQGFDAARMMGNVAPMTAAMGAVPMGGGAVSRMALGGTQGALGGALQPVQDTDNFALEKAKQVGMGAATGAAFSGAVAAKDKLSALAERPELPPVNQLKSRANAAYEAADQAGVEVNQSSVNTLADALESSIKQGGYHKKLHPRIGVVLEELDSLRGRTPTLGDLEIYRRILRNAGTSMDDSERRLAGNLIEKLDDFVENLKPGQLASGDQSGINAMFRARKLWRQAKATEAMEDMVERAGVRAGQFTGSGFENALRTEFRQFALNKKKMRGLTETQQAAIKKVASGGPVGNIVRWIGKWAPTGVVSTTAGGGLGGAVGGPVGALALPALGQAGRIGANALTSRNARLAAEAMRGGRAPANLKPLSPEQDFIRRVLQSGGIAGQR